MGKVAGVSSAPRPRGRPRSEKTRQAILAAADELFLEHGVDAVNMDEVAERAGASKATIYRWWPSKHVLALDALVTAWEEATGLDRDRGSLRADLRALVRPWVKRVAARPYARMIAALVAEVHRDPAFGEIWRVDFVQERRRRGRAAFVRAIERGEIAASTDVELALDLLYGSLYHRLLHGHEPITERIGDRIVDAVLGGVTELARSA